MGVYWNMGSIGLEFYEGSMNRQKYVSILETILIKLKRCFQKWILQWDHDSKHKSNVSLKFYITI